MSCSSCRRGDAVDSNADRLTLLILFVALSAYLAAARLYLFERLSSDQCNLKEVGVLHGWEATASMPGPPAVLNFRVPGF
jgi:hypothetical protein